MKKRNLAGIPAFRGYCMPAVEKIYLVKEDILVEQTI